MDGMIIGLIIILLLVLFLPFTKYVEHNLEVFLFIMGIASVLVSQVLDWPLIREALIHPINITLAVLFAGLLFRWFQRPIENGILRISQAMPYRLFIALFVIILGLISSIITAIVAAIVLVSVVSVLRMDRKSEIRLVILACYAIGLGAVLTPIGEPLSTIATNKLEADFFYLFRMLGVWVIPGVIVFGIISAFTVKSRNDSAALVAETEDESNTEEEAVDEKDEQETDVDNNSETMTEPESYKEIIVRSFKIYLFVMALTFLGAGFEPFIERYLIDLSPNILYWINMISAVLDNATLAAAEISPALSDPAILAIL